jgi:hypothetical protein
MAAICPVAVGLKFIHYEAVSLDDSSVFASCLLFDVEV